MGIAPKLVRLVAVLFAVSVLTFLMTQLLPGNPAVQILGPSATPERVKAVEHDLNLDKPLPVQYAKWLGDVLHGNLGRAYSNNQRVGEIIQQRIPVTVELLLLAQLIAIGLAIPIATYSAYRRDGVADKVTTTTAFGMLSIPDFVLAIILVFLFAVTFNIFPATGYKHLTGDGLVENLKSVFLPSVAIALPVAAVYIRLLRSDMISTLQEDFILMARSQGLPARRILLRHALRPSSFTLLTVAGINMGALIGGVVIVEYLFALPGMGTKMVESIFRRDYLVVQGLVLVIATGYVLVNFAVDLLYTVLDPRTRHASS